MGYIFVRVVGVVIDEISGEFFRLVFGLDGRFEV